ncbi:MAG: cytochrome c oxidase subunit 3 [Verrucomicrobiales bacterium]
MLPDHQSTKRLPKAALPLEPPGGVLVWLVVALELLTFAAGIGVFLHAKGTHPGEFAAGAQGLDQPLALANTLLLLTGGWFMGMAVAAISQNRGLAGARWLGLAIVAGIGFLGLKGVEWAGKIGAGASFGGDHFYTIYFALTGFHFAHVAAAVVILTYLRHAVLRGRYTAADYFDIESGGIFWHMCDLIWLLLYPVIYLI